MHCLLISVFVVWLVVAENTTARNISLPTTVASAKAQQKREESEKILEKKDVKEKRSLYEDEEDTTTKNPRAEVIAVLLWIPVGFFLLGIVLCIIVVFVQGPTNILRACFGRRRENAEDLEMRYMPLARENVIFRGQGGHNLREPRNRTPPRLMEDDEPYQYVPDPYIFTPPHFPRLRSPDLPFESPGLPTSGRMLRRRIRVPRRLRPERFIRALFPVRFPGGPNPERDPEARPLIEFRGGGIPQERVRRRRAPRALHPGRAPGALHPGRVLEDIPPAMDPEEIPPGRFPAPVPLRRRRRQLNPNNNRHNRILNNHNYNSMQTYTRHHTCDSLTDASMDSATVDTWAFDRKEGARSSGAVRNGRRKGRTYALKFFKYRHDQPVNKLNVRSYCRLKEEERKRRKRRG